MLTGPAGAESSESRRQVCTIRQRDRGRPERNTSHPAALLCLWRRADPFRILGNNLFLEGWQVRRLPLTIKKPLGLTTQVSHPYRVSHYRRKGSSRDYKVSKGYFWVRGSDRVFILPTEQPPPLLYEVNMRLKN